MSDNLIKNKQTHDQIKVIGAGFGRTGTLSLKTALDELNLKCYHMATVLEQQDHKKWININEMYRFDNGKNIDWDQLYKKGNYEATVDWPSTTYWECIFNYYPNAKIILTERDFESWYVSAENSIYKLYGFLNHVWFNRLFGPPMKKLLEVLWEEHLQGKFQNKQEMKKLYYDHIENVKKSVPENKLLIFNVKQGWEPLCKFLDKPVPNTPFPHVNDQKDFSVRVRRIQMMYYIENNVILIVVACVFYFIFKRM